MALFRRNKTDETGMPTEVRDYYKAEGRERTGLAWLLALGTLLLTVVIVLGLFMGGRWAFRKLKDSDKPTSPVAVQNDNQDEQNKPAEPGQSEAPATQPAPAAQTPTTPPAASGSAGSTNRNLANTGPGDTAAVFAAVTVLAYLVHRRFLSE